MAKVKIINTESNRKVKMYDSVDHNVKIINTESNRKVRIDEILPFRIKFINVQIPGYTPTNVPPIGIAIIGVNNYIL